MLKPKKALVRYCMQQSFLNAFRLCSLDALYFLVDMRKCIKYSIEVVSIIHALTTDHQSIAF